MNPTTHFEESSTLPESSDKPTTTMDITMTPKINSGECGNEGCKTADTTTEQETDSTLFPTTA